MSDRQRLAPVSLEAEESLLGAMLLSRDAIQSAIDGRVEPGDFHKPAHGHIYRAIVALHEREEPVDPVTVSEELRATERLASVGGRTKLLDIQAATPASANAGSYAKTVVRYAAARRAISLLDEALEHAWDGDPMAVLDLIDGAIETIAPPLDDVHVPIGASMLAAEDHNVDWIVRGWLARHEEVLIVAPPGCLAGDTMLTLNRAGKGFQCSIRDTERMFHGGIRSGKPWDPSIPTTTSRAVDGVARRGVVADVWQSGVQTTWTLTTDSGRSIRATADHRFLTPNGFVCLGALEPGDRLCVDLGQGMGRQPRKRYLSLNTAHHPRQRPAGHGQFRVWTHRLVMEAHLNGLDLHQIGIETIASIARYGDEMTYDLAVEDAPHNFLANGFAVHNSGKTTLLNQIAVCLGSGLHPWTFRQMPVVRVLVFDFQDSRGARGRNVQHLLKIAGKRYPANRGDPDTVFYELHSEGIDLTGRTDQRWFEAKVAKVRPDVIIAGPLYNMVQGAPTRSKQSEETAQLAGKFLAELVVRYDCALLIEAHAPHGEELRVRGSKYWEDWAGWGLGLRASIVDDRRQFALERFRGDREAGRQWPTRWVQGHPDHWPWDVPPHHLPPDPSGGTESLFEQQGLDHDDDEPF